MLKAIWLTYLFYNVFLKSISTIRNGFSSNTTSKTGWRDAQITNMYFLSAEKNAPSKKIKSTETKGTLQVMWEQRKNTYYWNFWIRERRSAINIMINTYKSIMIIDRYGLHTVVQSPLREINSVHWSVDTKEKVNILCKRSETFIKTDHKRGHKESLNSK